MKSERKTNPHTNFSLTKSQEKRLIKEWQTVFNLMEKVKTYMESYSNSIGIYLKYEKESSNNKKWKH